MRRVSIMGAIVSVLAVAPAASAQSSTIDEAVKTCIDVVHATKADEFERMFYKEFDAYYNPATKLVENNAYRNGDRRPLYTFNKCMVQKGFPLGPPAKSE